MAVMIQPVPPEEISGSAIPVVWKKQFLPRSVYILSEDIR